MAWTAPMTATLNGTFTAAQWNQYVRDNLGQTMPAKATAVGSLMVGNGSNVIVERFPAGSMVLESQQTTSTTYTNLLTVGPDITVTTGTSALVFFGAAMQNVQPDVPCWMSVRVQGATTIAANDQWCIANPSRQRDSRFGNLHRFTGLNPGSNTFRCQYRVTGGWEGFFANREIFVIPL